MPKHKRKRRGSKLLKTLQTQRNRLVKALLKLEDRIHIAVHRGTP